MVTGYWNGRSSIPDGVRNIYLIDSVHGCSEAHTESYPMGIWGSFPGGKAAEA
jgi:hypothetical protein